CGLSSRVVHVCGDILNGTVVQEFDAIISFLCFLHIPDRAKLFSACRAALKPDGVMYIEDFGKSRPLSAAEAKALSVKVQCSMLPGRNEYEADLITAGFP